MVYICEAHPVDGWQITGNVEEGVECASPATDAERLELASTCALNLRIGLPVVIDPIDDPVAAAYGALPDRLYLIGTDGRIAYQGDEGPMGLRSDSVAGTLFLARSNPGASCPPKSVTSIS